MKKDSKNVWPYPGSRWMKFDFHTHTPASHDTTAWQNPICKQNKMTPGKWLLKYMEAEIDCVAVTDHNSGEWIDKLKDAYNQMRQSVDIETSSNRFRPLTLFPGVEISVSGGFHLLAIFDPSKSTRTITNLLASVGYQGTDGCSDEVTQKSSFDVVQAVLKAGGIPIPAHADQKKGLLQVKPGTRKCSLDASTVSQVIEIEDLIAVEWQNLKLPVPNCMERKTKRMAKILGSDCHDFKGNRVPGSHYTWIKMASPTLEGLRLALLDGNGISVRRSDDEEKFDPSQKPRHFITDIKINSARFMGRKKPEHLALTPYYNALIGGRGTGKSTIVNSIRLAYRRDKELQRLGEKTEIYRQFNSFIKPVKSRTGEGALRENTEICVELVQDGTIQRLLWHQDSQGVVVEEQDENGEWYTSSSQFVTNERFPVRLFSQGQIAKMAGESRQSLLDIIDEASSEIGDLHRAFEEAKSTWFSQRAQLREIDGQMKDKPELERKLEELNRKLTILEQSHHTDVFKAHKQTSRQRREVNTTLRQLQKMPQCIKDMGKDLPLDDWPEGTFDPKKDQDVLAWRADVDHLLDETRESFVKAANIFAEKVQMFGTDDRFLEWQQRANKVETDYQMLEASLEKNGDADINGFGHLVQKRQQIEERLKDLNQLQNDREVVKAQIGVQWDRVLDARKAITCARKLFVKEKLTDNRFVRIDVVEFGFDANNIERDLRDLLDCEDDRFINEILRVEDGKQIGGIALKLAQSENRENTLKAIKQLLINPNAELTNSKFRASFKKYLQNKLKRPEFADHISCWFPSDDLRIEYSQTGDGGDWSPITQGSQGERSAALLAFLLAFGDEPLILDQPEDDLDNYLIYELIVQQIRENKRRRQLIIVTHNPNVVINGDAEMVHVFSFRKGQCQVIESGALQEQRVREEVCRVMEGGHEAFSRRWARLGRKI